MSDPKRGRVLRRVLLLFTLAAVLPIGIAATISYYQVRSSLTEQAFARLHDANRFQGTVLLDRLLATEAALTRLAGLPGENSVYAGQLLEDLKVQVDAISSVDAEGNASPLLGGGQPGTFPRQAYEGGGQTLRTLIFRSDGYDEIFLAVNTPPGGKGGRLVARFRPDYLFGREEDHLLTTDFCIYDQRTALYCTSGLRPHLPDLHFYHSGDGRVGRFRWTSGGREYFATSRDLFLSAHFDAHAWTVLSAEDEFTVFEPIRMFRWLFPGVVTLSILGILLLVISQTRRQLTPLSVLRSGAQRLGDGQFDARITLDSGDEFEELADTFNNMAGKLGSQFRFLLAMAEIDSILLSSPDMVRVTGSIVRHLPEFLPANAAAIFVADADTPAQGRFFSHGQDSDGEILVERTGIDERSLQLLSATDSLLTMEAGKGVPDFLSDLVRDCNCLHLFPLHYEERMLGCLCLGTIDATGLAPEYRKQAQSVADRLTVALSAVERQQQLYDQAHFDSLTGLPNRSLFLDRLSQYLVQANRSKKHVAVLYADLDQFKLVNDTLGHSQGDEVLRQAADRFRLALRKSDTVARLSGDEFIFALPELTDVRDAVTIVESIIEDLHKPFTVMDQKFILGASFGIALYPQDGASAEVLIKNADLAMYRAKSDQRAQYRFFEESMNEEIVERVALGQQLRQAVNNRQLQLVYQPKVYASTQLVHSAEALLRWHHSQLGWIDPEKFVSVAEEGGLIEQIGDFVIHSACDQFAQWRAAGYAIEQIAINVSARQVLHTDIVGTVARALAKFQIPPACLELELTESLLIDDFVTTQGILLELQQLGVGLALDDFGTGYSSLSYLHQLPFDTLKIDKSFVQDIGLNPEVDAIVISIIALAKSLGKKIVAEGIENEGQKQFLAERGCELLQGYLYSRPLPAPLFADVLKVEKALPLVVG